MHVCGESVCNNAFPFVFQPVGFVTFDSRSGAEAAKNALNVSAKFLFTYISFSFPVPPPLPQSSTCVVLTFFFFFLA